MNTSDKKVPLTDFTTLRTLLKKQGKEVASSFKDKNFDKLGFALKIITVFAFVASFVFLFIRFSDVYFAVTINGQTDGTARAFELLTIIYEAVLIILTASAVAQINYALFHNEENMLLSAMPISGATLYFSKLISVYLRQLAVCVVFVLTVNLTFAARIDSGVWYYFSTLLMTVILPFVSIAIASFIVLPLRKAVYFFRGRFVLSFISSTLLLAAGIYVYYLILTGVKQILIGEDLRYFFDEETMTAIAQVTGHLYPAAFLAGFVLGKNLLVNGLAMLAIALAGVGISALMIKLLFTSAMQSKANGEKKFVGKKKPLSKPCSPFAALLRKEFITVFRTPSYMFSYFSVAVVMPLMVYFCLSLGDSMVTTLVGVDTSLELAVLLTLMFGALTNTFCATNVSRDGMMFYSVKAMPVSGKTVMFAKVVLCLIISCTSNLASAITVTATGYVTAGEGVIVALVGIALAFAQICYATRADMARPRFAQNERGEIKQPGELVSQIIVIGIVAAFLLGGVLLYIRIATALHGVRAGAVTYVVSVICALAAAALFYWYLIHRLEEKYRKVSGGY